MDDLRGKDLSWAYWYNTHQGELRRVAYGIAIGIVGFIWLINIIMLVRYFMDRSKTNQAIDGIGDVNVNYDSVKAPQDLIIDSTQSLQETADTIDIYAKIHNPNSYHAARFNYTLSVAGNQYDFTDGVIMPNSDHMILIGNVPGNATNDANVIISDISWQRIHGQAISTDFRVTALELVRSNLAVATAETTSTTQQNSNTTADKNTNFATPTEDITNTAVPQGDSITQLTGTLGNASAYGYRRVVVTAVLTNTAGVVVGAQQQVFTNMESFKDYNLVFNWQREFEFDVTPTVTVETDIWDNTNLILPGQD